MPLGVLSSIEKIAHQNPVAHRPIRRLCKWTPEATLDEATSRLLALLDAHGVRLHVLLTRITLREEAADDLLQELFLKLRKAEGFAAADRPEQYLFRAAIHLAFDWRRRRRQAPPPLPLREDTACERRTPVEQAIRREELDRVMAAVERLPPADRDLLVLRFLHRSSYEELAAHLNSTAHRVRALCCKAVGRLRRQLDRARTTEMSDVE